VAVAVLGGSTVQAGFAGLAVGVTLAGTYAIAQSFLVQLPSLAEQAVDDLPGAEAAGRRLAFRLELLAVPVGVGAALVVGPALPVVVGEGFAGAADAFVPALAVLPLVPPSALGAQAAALRLRAQTRTWATGAGAIVFLAVAAPAVPAWQAAGATTALLAATAVSVLALAVAVPGAIDRRLLAAGFGGAGLTLAAGLLAS